MLVASQFTVISLKGISLEPILRSHFVVVHEALHSSPVVSDVSKQDIGHKSEVRSEEVLSLHGDVSIERFLQGLPQWSSG